MDKEEHERLDGLIEGGYLQSDLMPLKCYRCESVELKETIKAVDGGQISESDVSCSDCGQGLGYWAYGSWQV